MRDDENELLRSTGGNGGNGGKDGLAPIVPIAQSPVFRLVFYSICILVVAYVLQFAWLAMESKGQNETDYTWEIVAHKVLSAQYDGLPQMRIGYAKPSHSSCGFWSFEAIWGACATVRIFLAVRDYQPEHRLIVDREVTRFADQMRMPCHLLPKLNLPNEAALANNLGCHGWKRKFKLLITVGAVTVANEKGPPDRPNRWSLNTVKNLYTYNLLEGKL